MKANKNVRFSEDTSAQVGIGTLIIFIAMVLVAAVAAAVLIQTSGVLQQRAQQTGSEATQEVSSNIDIKNIEGIRAANGDELTNTVDMLRLQLGLQSGSSPVDLNQLVVTITDGSSTNTLTYTDGNDPASEFGGENGNLERLQTTDGATDLFAVREIRDEDESFSQENPVMNTGDLVNMYISTASEEANTENHQINIDGEDFPTENSESGLTLDPRTEVGIVMTPEAGAISQASFITPSTYGVTDIVSLYP
ncbi:archaellin/type IV pilin N-terminal domain-containing protein [Methanosalsum natronophilum]|uniref:archaellin/type IV pilin N-terminal domain-containing protein n=1 Tax=Methanosalsum natronophilum TaxID=768733 RepID=UPI002167AE43|nr:archaellin/type IV pilin N-terminal domain-containing protein [Methanosalsum natronophilum]MCS3924567.1 flagellin FlaB [Methanosalsum natronophilum]